MNDLVELSHEILRRSEARIRQKIAALPDGVFEFGLDIDGYIDKVHLHATVEIRGSDIFVDYKGTSPQTLKAAINCVFNTTYASTLYPFKCSLVPTIPNNEGLFRPFHVSAPEGSILNTTFPYPVRARAKTTNNINQVLFGAVWPVLGGARPGRQRFHLALQGQRPSRGVRYLLCLHPAARRAGSYA